MDWKDTFVAKFSQLAAPLGLKAQLFALRQSMAEAAQTIYDEWEQDDDGFDELMGEGGICDQIAMAIAGVVIENVEDAGIADGGQDGSDHAFTIVYNDTEAYAVDIPARTYEVGAGYSWKKIPGVTFDAEDVQIWEVDRDLAVD